MFKGTYLRQDFYKRASNQYEDMINTVEEMKRKKVKKTEIVSYINMANADIERLLSDGHTETLKSISDKISKLKHEYATKRQYVDPQLEALQRQDWDIKLSNMSDNEINEYITNDLNDNVLSIYQLSVLKNRLKEVNSLSVNKGSLETKMIQYQNLHNIGEEYKNTDEYNELLQLQSECVSYGKQHLWRYDTANDKSELIDFRGAKSLLDGYDVEYSF